MNHVEQKLCHLLRCMEALGEIKTEAYIYGNPSPEAPFDARILAKLEVKAKDALAAINRALEEQV